MVGDGPDREKAEILAKELGINKNILFMGKSDEIKEILCLTDLFLLPSQTESFGLAALEAMAARTPVISTNTGGLSEVNIEGKTGFLSDVGDIPEMSKNAIYLLEDEERLNRFKDAAYDHAHKFSLENILPLYEDMYRKVKENCC
jgi:N-acetyl-alpha-D-glucosaminyl L-malate synthase BshA